jgi:hypothetical protein
MPDPIRITIGRRFLHQERAPSFEALLDGEVLCRSQCPVYEAARVLLARGYGPERLMTARHASLDYDSIKPARIGYLAQWAVEESGERGLRLRKWRPHPRTQDAVSLRAWAMLERMLTDGSYPRTPRPQLASSPQVTPPAKLDPADA